MHRPGRENDRLRELAAVIARGFLRLSETSRRDAVSCAQTPMDPLDVSALSRPHVDENEAA
jgi:hypothetical protein